MTRATISLIAGFGLILAAMSGCHSAGRSFRLDSDSRMPFFGLQFMAKDREPRAVQTVGHEEPEPVEDDAPSSIPPSKLDASRWTKWLNPLAVSPKHIPLPRTDLAEGANATDKPAGPAGPLLSDF